MPGSNIDQNPEPRRPSSAGENITFRSIFSGSISRPVRPGFRSPSGTIPRLSSAWAFALAPLPFAVVALAVLPFAAFPSAAFLLVPLPLALLALAAFCLVSFVRVPFPPAVFPLAPLALWFLPFHSPLFHLLNLHSPWHRSPLAPFHLARFSVLRSRS